MEARKEALPATRHRTAVTLGMVFRLVSRQTEGFLRSLLTWLSLDHDVPDHTTISRRKARLGKVLLGVSQSGKPIHILNDSSGVSVHVGPFRKPPKNRDYRKLHICVNEKTGEVVAAERTSKSAPDSSRVKSQRRQVKHPPACTRADAGYDAKRVYRAVERARHIQSEYSQRSKVETAFSRYQAMIGPTMRARRLSSQRVEVRIGGRILNVTTALRMLDGITL